MAKFGEQFLHKKDQKLHTSKPVELEMERKKAVGEEVSQKPADKISDWLEVIKRTHTGHRDNPEVLERIKDYYHKENVIKSEDIPENYYENQKRLAREQGHGDIEITKEMKAQLSEVIIKDQQTTLDNWTNYFTSPDADAYPMWAKYWAFTSMLKLSSFDKEKHAFGKRDKNTVAPFPDLNREALAYVVDVVAKSVNDPEKAKKVFEWAIPELNELLKNQSFGKLYAYAIEKHEKKSADMKLLTEIDNKAKKEEKLTKDELVFLYEINSKIEGFGYQRDPRIKEIIDQRNPKEDAPIVFGCEPSQIAHNQKEINENTKAYIGPLFKGIFQTNIEHIGTSFPEGMVKKMEAEIGGKSKKELIQELKEKKINISDYAKQMMDNPDFTTSKKQEHLGLIRLTVKDLGFPEGATIDKIYKKAEELGLELCPAETGPNLRLQDFSPDLMFIGMKQIAGRGGGPDVFSLSRVGGGLWLGGNWASSEDGWGPVGEFVFVLRK